MRNATVVLMVELMTFVGCGGDRPRSVARDDWVVESWKDRVFTFLHDGSMYTATCDSTTDFRDGKTFVNGVLFSDALDHGTPSPRCESTIDLVGRTIPSSIEKLLPAGGTERDADGWVVTITHVGTTLMVRRWRGQTTHSEELLSIESITKEN